MNHRLERLAERIGLADSNHERLRFEFGHACVTRVGHLLEMPELGQCLAGLGSYLAGTIDRAQLSAVAAQAARLANRHEGSKSIDGCGHAAVSASFAVAKAAEGKAVEAASYAAYAAVYAQGGYAAVSDRDSFEPEFEWQSDLLESLAARTAIRA